LLGLFKASETGRDFVLEKATLEDMCGSALVTKPSLEVVYDNV
jgi:chlorophyllide a reductase subunit X